MLLATAEKRAVDERTSYIRAFLSTVYNVNYVDCGTAVVAFKNSNLI